MIVPVFIRVLCNTVQNIERTQLQDTLYNSVVVYSILTG